MSSNSDYFFNPKNSIKDAELNDYSSKYTIEEPITEYQGGPRIKNSVKENYRNFVFIITLVLAGLCVLLARLVYLQVVQGTHYREIAEGNRIRIETVKAPRGVIYDTHEHLLVKNVPNFRLDIIPGDLYQNSENIQKLQSLLKKYLPDQDLSVDSFLQAHKKYSFRAVTFVEHIPYESALILKIETSDISGVKLIASASREYIGGESFSHITGYTGKISPSELESETYKNYELTDYVGKSGLEYEYEALLKGTDGKKEIEVDSKGRETEVLAQKESHAGENLVLSVDYDLQNYIYETVSAYLKDNNLTAAAVVVLDPQSGRVLSILSFPTFDNNIFHRGLTAEEAKSLFENPDNPLLFRPTQGTYPSGSTFKTVVASAALQEGVITSKTTVMSTGGLKVDAWTFPDWKAGGHGLTDLRKALAESVNTFFYIAGGGYDGVEGLGVARISEFAGYFGLGAKTGIDLPGENTGFLPTKQWKKDTIGETWYVGDTYHYAIGQGYLLVTPLEITNAIASIINGGILYSPKLVRQIVDENGIVVKEISPEVIRENFIDTSNLDLVKLGLKDAVAYGSARSLQSLPVSSGGKTGTAQFGTSDAYHSWFVGFAPFDNPEIIITVLVEKAGEGNEAALPIAKNVLEWYFSDRSAVK